MSPRTEEENLRIREEQRERIRRAALRVFARKGLAATRISDIAAAADVSYGLVYHYFKSKEELFASLVESAMRGAGALFQAAEQRPGTPWERLLWFTEQSLEGIRRNPESFILITQVNVSEAVGAELREQFEQLSKVTIETCQRIVSEGQACGQFVQGDPYKLTLIFLACIQGISSGSAFFRPQYLIYPEAEDIMRILKP